MSIVVSLCVLQIEVCDDEDQKSRIGIEIGKMSEKGKYKSRRQARQISVETHTNASSSSCKSPPLLPVEGKIVSIKPEKCIGKNKGKMSNLQFFSGNPFVEVTKGILHLYKENLLSDVNHESFNGKILCILAVPANMTCYDLFNFTAACHNDIQHVRIIRDGSVNQYMALIYFRTVVATVGFYKTFNGVPFNSMESETICQLVFVSKVEISRENESVAPVVGHTELPTCPVCLERMDESVDGILTILCNHSFHSNCLAKWGDSSCPVCRYVQTPEMIADNKCFECQSENNLWICLICGHVGCGRYVGRHAHKHYLETSHCYAMQLGSNHVWDYVGDNFVHRLLQNKDGKMVEGSSGKNNSGESGGGPDTNEKVDSIQLEYTYLLTTQLESQRNYYEEKLSRLGKEKNSESLDLVKLTKESECSKKDLEVKLNQMSKEKNALDKKVQQLNTKLCQTQAALNDEKQMGRALQENQILWQDKFTQLEKDFNAYKEERQKEITELKDQLRDVMFYFQAQAKISESADKDEIQGGQIILGQSPSTSKSNNKIPPSRKKGKKR